jgi:hypothetical protein
MMPLTHPGVCVLAQNLFFIRLGLTFFLCGGDTAAVLPVHPTLYVYLFPLVFAVSVVIPTSCCFFMSLIPSLLAHDDL